MIKQLLNSVIAKYRDLTVARKSITCLCLRNRKIIDLLATDKSRYFAQPRPIIVYYLLFIYTVPGVLLNCFGTFAFYIQKPYYKGGGGGHFFLSNYCICTTEY